MADGLVRKLRGNACIKSCLYRYTRALSGGGWSDAARCFHISIAKHKKTGCCSGFFFVACLIHLCSLNEEQVKDLELFQI